ncbi:MAG: alpha-amylase family glycosyl hydrolase [Ignavibacteriaceae bacterium]
MKFSGFRILSKVKYEFHVSKDARAKYSFDQSLFSITGDLIVANFYQARVLSEKINNKRKEEGSTQLVTAGQINALGLLHEIFHFLIRLYEEKENPGVFSKGVNHLKNTLGETELNRILLEYVNDFPPLEVYNGKILAEDFLKGSTQNKPNSEIILEELILLNLGNENPATVSLEELYSDKPLSKRTQYLNLINETEKFFVTEKPFGPDNLSLTQFLRKPIKTNPNSIEGQLDYILSNWGAYIYQKFYERLLGSKDLIHEDYKLFVPHGGGEKGTPPVPQYKFDADFFERIRAKLARGEQLTDEEAQFYYAETEQFTTDIDWMPKVVMLAKNTYVWLDQLSKKYQREIKRLDQIPDEELDALARWNFTALWLIGIWERSSASKKVKHLTGNPEAVSSAYSLYDYVIAQDIGGEGSFQNLKDRCWHRGIRLSSDMVPNHTGIYSKWVIEKPDYFIQTSYPPYPGYSFNGPNLSDDHRVEVRIEDKYYNRTDASVVFQRLDSYTGDIRYIYHGNDGTHMPWNDTAQLNLLIPEVRESLIQTIMHVARKTPIIRFDAAMTLAKKHFQRLWFPQPGTGGAVPSRSDAAMTRAAFDEVMPVEFWREVVDRINTEMPQTLLLAEAFWLMESYFVRTLGMHRVYNSAFMHMMMKEENDKYRELMKNTLEFNPEILKRYVNFMSNPDEETAINQFGKGDKYFGICVMLVTMPGLPMFAHGQIEGFSEKYGMEYQRAYYDEFVDDNLITRHEAEIFPLSQKRYLFSQVYHFELYDFINIHGDVADSVYAYSNKSGDEKALVLFNNSFNECSGTINYSSQKASAAGHLYNNKLADALSLKNDGMFFYICREHRSNLEYLLNGKDMHDFGYYTYLAGYEYKVFIDFREIYDITGIYRTIYDKLNGRGISSVHKAIQELQLIPVHNSARELFSSVNFDKFSSYCFDPADEGTDGKAELTKSIDTFLREFNSINEIPVDIDFIINTFSEDLAAVKEFNKVWKNNSSKKRIPQWIADASELIKIFSNGKESRDILYPVIVFKNFSAGLAMLKSGAGENIFDRLMMDVILYESLEARLNFPEKIAQTVELLKFLSRDANIHNSGKVILKQLFPDEGKKLKKGGMQKSPLSREEFFINRLFKLNNEYNYLKVNQYKESLFYHKESFADLIDWIYTLSVLEESKKFLVRRLTNGRKAVKKDSIPADKLEKIFISGVKKETEFYKNIKTLSLQSGYKVKELISLTSKTGADKADTEKKEKKSIVKKTEKKSSAKKAAAIKTEKKSAEKKTVKKPAEKKTVKKPAEKKNGKKPAEKKISKIDEKTTVKRRKNE